MFLTIFKFRPNSTQIGALEGKDRVSEQFAFSPNCFRSLNKNNAVAAFISSCECLETE